MPHGNSPESHDAAYVAVRFPPAHVVFHLINDDGVSYESIRDRVLASVREALEVLGVVVVEQEVENAMPEPRSSSGQDAGLSSQQPEFDSPSGHGGAGEGRAAASAASCSRCDDEAWVCESHPDEAWEHADCGGAGMPCPDCNTEDPPRFGPGVLAVEYLTHDPRWN